MAELPIKCLPWIVARCPNDILLELVWWKDSKISLYAFDCLLIHKLPFLSTIIVLQWSNVLFSLPSVYSKMQPISLPVSYPNWSKWCHNISHGMTSIYERVYALKSPVSAFWFWCLCFLFNYSSYPYGYHHCFDMRYMSEMVLITNLHSILPCFIYFRETLYIDTEFYFISFC